MSNQPRYIILTQPIRIPGAHRVTEGRRVALIEVDPAYTGTPQAISARAMGVRRIVNEWHGTGIQPVVAAEALKSRLESR